MIIFLEEFHLAPLSVPPPPPRIGFLCVALPVPESTWYTGLAWRSEVLSATLCAYRRQKSALCPTGSLWTNRKIYCLAKGLAESIWFNPIVLGSKTIGP